MGTEPSRAWGLRNRREGIQLPKRVLERGVYGGEEGERQNHKSVEASSYLHPSTLAATCCSPKPGTLHNDTADVPQRRPQLDGSPKAERRSVADPENVVTSEL